MLSIRQLSRAFREGGRVHQVLAHAEAEVRSGETVVVTGRSGSGKSTLLNLISGIDQPDSGTVQVDGREVTAMAEPERTVFRRAHIGFVYQFFNLIPTLDVAENVRLVLELNGLRGARAHERSLAALAEVGLRERAHSAVDQLSGGEQQRVAIARALINEPMLLLADEPTGNLDPEMAQEIMRLFLEVNARGTTVVVATHDREMIQRMGKRVISLERGRVASA